MAFLAEELGRLAMMALISMFRPDVPFSGKSLGSQSPLGEAALKTLGFYLYVS